MREAIFNRRTMISTLASCGILLTLPGCAFRQSSDEGAQFLIGVWQQPEWKIPEHLAGGINTFVSLPSGSDRSTWVSALQSAGVAIIAEPPAGLEQIRREAASNLRIVAYLLPDEPDLKPSSRVELRKIANLIKLESPTTPMFVNFSGSVLSGVQEDENGERPTDNTYRELAGACEFVSHGLYPVAGWNRPDWIDLTTRATTEATIAIDRLGIIHPGGRRIAIIETGPQNLPWLQGAQPQPTPEQIRGQVWDAVLNGAQGIIYFTIAIDPFSWDSRTPETKETVREINKELQTYSRYLKGSRSELNYLASIESAKFTDTSGASAVISLNMSPHATKSRDGRTYKPYEVKFDEN